MNSNSMVNRPTRRFSLLVHANPLDQAHFTAQVTNPLYAQIDGLDDPTYNIAELKLKEGKYSSPDGKVPFTIATNGNILITAIIDGPFMLSDSSGEYYFPLEARVYRKTSGDPVTVISKMTCSTPGEQTQNSGNLEGPNRYDLYFDIEAKAGQAGEIENLKEGAYETTLFLIVEAPLS